MIEPLELQPVLEQHILCLLPVTGQRPLRRAWQLATVGHAIVRKEAVEDGAVLKYKDARAVLLVGSPLTGVGGAVCVVEGARA